MALDLSLECLEELLLSEEDIVALEVLDGLVACNLQGSCNVDLADGTASALSQSLIARARATVQNQGNANLGRNCLEAIEVDRGGTPLGVGTVGGTNSNSKAVAASGSNKVGSSKCDS